MRTIGAGSGGRLLCRTYRHLKPRGLVHRFHRCVVHEGTRGAAGGRGGRRKGEGREYAGIYNIRRLWASRGVTNHCVVSYGKYRAHARTQVNTDIHYGVVQRSLRAATPVFFLCAMITDFRRISLSAFLLGSLFLSHPRAIN